jgi:hypothetical protein
MENNKETRTRKNGANKTEGNIKKGKKMEVEKREKKQIFCTAPVVIRPS